MVNGERKMQVMADTWIWLSTVGADLYVRPGQETLNVTGGKTPNSASISWTGWM